MFLYYIYITGCWFQVAQDGDVMAISLECLFLMISGKSLFVKILVNRLLVTGKRNYLTLGNRYKNNKFKLNKVLRSKILFSQN